MEYTKKFTALQKGLSLIESAMVLAISAAVVSGVLYYYNHAKENRALEQGIKDVQNIAATINKLYTNSATPMMNLSDVVEAISVVSGVATKMVGQNKVFVNPTGSYTQFWWDTTSRKYTLEILTNSISSCMSYATLNLGTLMAGKTQITPSNGSAGGHGDPTPPYNLTPADASSLCKENMNKGQAGSFVKIRYTMQY
ncbi:type II secretion system protein [Escherichia coli]|uniref:type II secretion system protein n=1 Tax=Escherichia coli TaxID=562 RepID=UPI000BE146A9|nr:branched-chain alpha-keto acid dehydrogenase subunit E2 [Escherichia coli]